VISSAILPAIQARLAAALAAPHLRYRPLVVDGNAVGWLDDARAKKLTRYRRIFCVEHTRIAFDAKLTDASSRSAAIADVARALRAERELPAWRDELYAVSPAFDARPAFTLERGAARWFGVRTWAAHVNGVTGKDGKLRMWLARRSADKAVDPGLLDNLIGGGIAAGTRVDQTVAKEAWEEAGIRADVVRRARPAGALHVRRVVADGLQRETMFVHDLALAPEFRPVNQDGEAHDHRLVDLAQAARLIAVTDGADEVTVDASLVVLDYLLRHGAIAPDAPHYVALEALRFAGADR
jgi:8-oxo-dGTP pyrophosphatase MutT (NUDIX family)